MLQVQCWSVNRLFYLGLRSTHNPALGELPRSLFSVSLVDFYSFPLSVNFLHICHLTGSSPSMYVTEPSRIRDEPIAMISYSIAFPRCCLGHSIKAQQEFRKSLALSRDSTFHFFGGGRVFGHGLRLFRSEESFICARFLDPRKEHLRPAACIDGLPPKPHVRRMDAKSFRAAAVPAAVPRPVDVARAGCVPPQYQPNTF